MISNSQMIIEILSGIYGSIAGSVVYDAIRRIAKGDPFQNAFNESIDEVRSEHEEYFAIFDRIKQEPEKFVKDRIEVIDKKTFSNILSKEGVLKEISGKLYDRIEEKFNEIIKDEAKKKPKAFYAYIIRDLDKQDLKQNGISKILAKLSEFTGVKLTEIYSILLTISDGQIEIKDMIQEMLSQLKEDNISMSVQEKIFEEPPREDDYLGYSSGLEVISPTKTIFVAYRNDVSLNKVFDKIIDITEKICADIFGDNVRVMPWTIIHDRLGIHAIPEIYKEVINSLGFIAIISPEWLQFMWAHKHSDGIHAIIKNNEDEIRIRSAMHLVDEEERKELLSRITKAPPAYNVLYELGLFYGSQQDGGIPAAIIGIDGTYIPGDIRGITQITAKISADDHYLKFKLAPSSSREIKNKIASWIEQLNEKHQPT